ncbi:unnamed protein product, partial [Brugia timori]
MIANGADGKIELSDELKVAIATEVRAQIVPVVKEIVREVVTEIRSVMTEVMAPIYDELNRLRSTTTATANGGNANALQLHAASAVGTSIATPATVVAYPSESAILAEVYAATSNVAVSMGGTACADAATAAAVAAQNAQLQQFLK